MSIINGIGAFGASLGSFAGSALKDELGRAPERTPLLNATPSAPITAAPDTTAAPAPTAGAGDIEPSAMARAQAVRDGLIKRGLDPETATAFAANALHESGANPGTGAGDAGASHGLFQWRGPRLDAYVAKNGHAPDGSPLDEQLDFVMHELNGSESAAMNRIALARGPDGKAAAISQAYLRPKDVLPEMQRRSATALQLARAGMPDQSTDAPWVQNLKRLVQPNVDPRSLINPRFQNTDPGLNRLGPRVGSEVQT